MGGSVVMSSNATLIVKPTNTSGIFLVVEGSAVLNNSVLLDMSGRNYTSTITVIAVVQAGAIAPNGAPAQETYVGIDHAPKGKCTGYSANSVQSATALNVVLAQDDSACKPKSKLTRIVITAIVAGLLGVALVRARLCALVVGCLCCAVLQLCAHD